MHTSQGPGARRAGPGMPCTAHYKLVHGVECFNIEFMRQERRFYEAMRHVHHGGFQRHWASTACLIPTWRRLLSKPAPLASRRARSAKHRHKHRRFGTATFHHAEQFQIRRRCLGSAWQPAGLTQLSSGVCNRAIFRACSNFLMSQDHPLQLT